MQKIRLSSLTYLLLRLLLTLVGIVAGGIALWQINKPAAQMDNIALGLPQTVGNINMGVLVWSAVTTGLAALLWWLLGQFALPAAEQKDYASARRRYEGR